MSPDIIYNINSMGIYVIASFLLVSVQFSSLFNKLVVEKSMRGTKVYIPYFYQ